MRRLIVALAVGTLALVGAARAQQPNVSVRGTITAFDAGTLSVKSRDNRDLQVLLPENVPVSTTKALTLGDLKPGAYVGATTIKRPDGAVVALEVHLIPPTAPSGLTPSDLQPGSTMTNANVDMTVQAASGHELTLNYKTGSVKVLVPDGIPIVQAVPGDRSVLKPGTYVYIAARAAPDGKLTAIRVQASKDGVKPPQ